MSIRLAAVRLFKNGRQLVRHIHKSKISSFTRAAESGPPAPSRPATFVQQVTQNARRVVVDAVLSRVTHTVAADLRRKVTRQLLYGDSRPFFALVGVSLASGTGIISKDDQLEAVCWEIRDAVNRSQSLRKNQLFTEDVPEIGLENLEFGPEPLAKGCSAVVYPARWRNERAEASTSNDSSDPSIYEFPLAVKMMFNYDAESNASAILHAMLRETVPAWSRDFDVLQVLDYTLTGRMSSLSPHPNIVEMYRVFTDRIPNMPGAMDLYPDALPARINPAGSGRNMSLFLIMKRYECSLRDFVKKSPPSPRVAQLLFAQLLEAVAHMKLSNIAHRDLKSDNVLVDLVEGDDACPVVAVSDFGCCLADSSHGLSLPFSTPHVDRGGNAALMAPEVVCARPGPFTSINYSKSDLWSVGTLAYELFGMDNPFAGVGATLYNRTYSDEDLPELPEIMPAPLKALVYAILSRNPSKRPSPELAATISQLILWAPSEWLNSKEMRAPSSNEVLQWLLSLATKVLCEGNVTYSGRGRRTLPEYQLITSLLGRVKLQQVRQALTWIHQNSM
ncbi:serine/threonine-protein kinase Pink1, mitochondrial [Neocloeon triangulifer]|uniref:serine/threonine-protein kinase Pink1, mitochondrial n=1 Tax=Neocloeon triangulifer TaxID=2078957 RepID=UPI00286F7FA0|nr:serine/threonine-protein kinase Pink1, mitochondrial [Neocloeon triangulifer]